MLEPPKLAASLSPPEEGPQWFALSRRERECLLWAARGKTYAEIGLILGLSFASIKTYLDHCRYKLNCATLPQATAFAVGCGILTIDDLTSR